MKKNSGGPSKPPKNRGSLWFGVATALLTVVVILGAALFVAFNHPYRAVWMLAGGLIVIGFLRAVWPGHPWFGSRSRWLDVTVYWLTGGALLFLSPWVSLIPG